MTATFGKQTIVSKLNATAETGFALSIENTTGYLHAEIYLAGVTGVTEVIGQTAIPNGQWSHIVFTFDGQNLELYLNGSPDNAATLGVVDSITPSADALTLGASSGVVPADEFTGLIDEVQIYSSLNAADVMTLATAAGGEPGLLFYESFDSIGAIWAEGAWTDLQNINDTDLVDGPFGNALHMQNAGEEDELLSWPMSGHLDPDKGHITFWYRPDDGPDMPGGSILETEDGGKDGGIRIYRWNNPANDLQFRLLAQNNYLTSAQQEPHVAKSWQAGEWHYLEVIWDLTVSEPYMAYVADGEIGHVLDSGIQPNPGATDPVKLHIGSRGHRPSVRQDCQCDLPAVGRLPDRSASPAAGPSQRGGNDGFLSLYRQPSDRP